MHKFATEHINNDNEGNKYNSQHHSTCCIYRKLITPKENREIRKQCGGEPHKLERRRLEKV